MWYIQTQKSIIISVYYLIDLLIRIVMGIGCVYFSAKPYKNQECVVTTAAVNCWCIVFTSTNFTQLADTEKTKCMSLGLAESLIETSAYTYPV